MSVEFTLSGSSLEDWNEVLLEWARDQGELYEEPVFQPDGSAFLIGPGSARGVLLTQGDGGLDVRLSACASRADWRRAYAFLKLALERGGGTLVCEGEAELAAADLTPEAAEEYALRDMEFSAQAVRQSLTQAEEGAGSAQLPLGKFSLVLSAADVPEGDDLEAFEARLAERVERYATAFAASTMVLKNGTRLSTWACIPTLVGRVHLVAIQGLEQPVPWEVVAEALGDRAEPAGDVTFVPGIDPQRDSALWKRLEAAQIDPERFAEENAELLAQELAESPSAGGGVDPLETMRAACKEVVAGLVAGGDVAEIRRELIGQGHDQAMVDATFAGAAALLQIVQQHQGSARAVHTEISKLVAEGFPQVLVETLLSEFNEHFKDDEPPQGGAGCCLLLVALAIAAVWYLTSS